MINVVPTFDNKAVRPKGRTALLLKPRSEDKLTCHPQFELIFNKARASEPMAVKGGR